MSASTYIEEQKKNRPRHPQVPKEWWGHHEKRYQESLKNDVAVEVALAGRWVQERCELKGCFSCEQIKPRCESIGMSLFFVVMGQGDIWATTKRFVQRRCRFIPEHHQLNRARLLPDKSMIQRIRGSNTLDALRTFDWCSRNCFYPEAEPKYYTFDVAHIERVWAHAVGAKVVVTKHRQKRSIECFLLRPNGVSR